MADSSAAPMTPANMASCMTSTVLIDSRAWRDALCGMRDGAEQGMAAPSGQAAARRATRRETRRAASRRPRCPNRHAPPESACPA